ncbi:MULTISPECIES: TetR/AcrR family transcriptional regulator [Pseudomonadaceae]|jgi:AcrR family transcriptional regulator|nr:MULTISPECIES: TetR/AcrR family transcriptional regulator [Pseudomonas]OZB34844.1 MAG: TetR family transcriptional regulator [Pseudomonas sp. 34-62-33]MBG6882729.1 TetR/AcrR family transcriptional regulator [Pseudomonas aeruginosa]MBV5858647.1 TetR/AcrR family transcriptional regulator [Pseudomonas aeruginosa]MCS9083355.1 TetR/AcrR family transcriptional regulator [Pseudomonas aeruginosa]MCT0697496.1 TetR/AcrR family transcriptional regulator [Pseudomonas aeruginosa]
MPPVTDTAREPRQARGQKRFDSVLDACARLLITQGEAALTMHGLAHAAQTSIGSLYHFFPDKRSVLEALGKRHLDALRVTAEQVEAQPDTFWASCTHEQLIDQLLRPYLEYSVRHPDFLHLIRRSGSSLPPTSDQQLEEKVHAMFLRALTLRLPMASTEEQYAYAATLFSLPIGMLTQQSLEYDAALRQRILTREIPRALAAYIGAIEAAHGFAPDKQRTGRR